MPELPEVETIRRGLERKIVGKTFKEVGVLYPKALQFDPKLIENQKVLNIWRRAKMLGVNLSGDVSLIFHLKMTGQLIFIGEKGERVAGGHPTESMLGNMPNSDTRVIFHFTDSSTLYFNDQIKFGWIKLARTSELDKQKELKELGPEPLNLDFTWQVLKDALLRRKKTPVKVALMDQSLIAGVGNIYANEALFLARIDPRKPAGSLSDEELKKLHRGIIDSLETSIKHGGTTIRNYVDVDGKRGEFIGFANVYGRAGQPCRGCKGKVMRITQGGRGTFFCPSCQK